MKWEPKFPVDYSSNGDDVDRFAQKTKAEFELIYHLLNALRQNFPCKNQPADTLPFQWYVDVSGGKIYMRNFKDDADLIRKGLKTLDDVPAKLRAEVEKLLNAE